jgi:phospho-N-acetylmuramoyl-pentapeptide-transferase
MQLAQIQTIPEVLAIAKIAILTFISFVLTIGLAPFWSRFLYKHNFGIKIKKKSVDGQALSYVNKLHAHKSGTPTMGGVLIWFSVLILIFSMSYLAPWLSERLNNVWISRLDFLQRNQTWLPLFALISTAILGLVDDYMSIKSIGSNKGGGMRFAWRFVWLFLVAALGAWWFYEKLGWHQVHVPALGDFDIGFWYIPLFMFAIIASAISSNETDGLDGLNAGILIQAFASFAIIAFFQDKMDLAAFCGAIAGSLTGFLWFNFYPARFFMGDTGAVSLGATLGVVAMLTNSFLVLPFVVFIYVVESLSVIGQLFAKNLLGRKIFLSAPIHHHFEAKGWPETKVTVRFWIINGMVAMLGILIGIIGRG